jgi:hypothetical protein
MVANVGAKYTYCHPDGMGFGEMVKANAGFGEQTAEMRELDLRNLQEVTLFDYDADSDWPIIEWTDATGITRLTTVDPDIFDSNFQEA